MRFNWIFLIFPAVVFAKRGFHEPWGTDSDLRRPVAQAPAAQHSLSVRIAEKIICFHQNVLSPVDGPRSHFRPSSSGYMKDAMKKHGFVTGFFMGCDRLMRENRDPWVYRLIEENGKWVKYDPVP